MRTPLILLALVVAGCAVNPVTGKSDFVLISTEKEKEIGKQAAAEVQAEMGFYDRAGLEAYIQAVGLRLAAHSPRQDVVYSFHVIDSDEPNAFALPGGYVYVTRGLLVLANSEDELACVIGHEIGHVAARHSVRQISRSAPFGLVTGITSGVVGLASPLLGSLVGGVGDLASGLVLAPYSRDQEREADRVGQQIAAEAGWDPAAMATFLRTLQRDEQLRGAGRSRFSFLATHPATPERVENTEAYARELHRADVPPLSPTRRDFLEHFVGMPTGTNVANGYFVGRTFVQPDLDILVEFPDGWAQRNAPSGAMVGAPDGGAMIILSLSTKGDDPMEGASKMQKEVGPGLVAQTERIEVGSLPAARTVFRARSGRDEVGIDVTWIAYHGDVFQITGITSVPQLTAYERPFAGTRDSFRPLTPAERAGVRENRLRLAEVRRGETVDDLIARTQASWSVAMLAVANDLPEPPPLKTGQTVKVSVPEKYP